jgi:hypothetical protein
MLDRGLCQVGVPQHQGRRAGWFHVGGEMDSGVSRPPSTASGIWTLRTLPTVFGRLLGRHRSNDSGLQAPQRNRLIGVVLAKAAPNGCMSASGRCPKICRAAR